MAIGGMGYNSSAYKAGTINPTAPRPPSSKRSEDDWLSNSYYNILDRSYNLHRNSSIPAAITRTMLQYVAGSGLTPIISNENTMRIWKSWTKSADITGTKTMSLIYKDIIAAQVESGDVLVTAPVDTFAPLDTIRTRIQLISGARVRTPSDFKEKKSPRGNKVILGVEFDSVGREIGYWVCNNDYDKSFVDDSTNYRYIPRYADSGRFSAFLLRRPDKMFCGQTRGLPMITNIIEEIETIAELWEAALQKGRTNASMNAFVEVENPVDLRASMGAVDTDGNDSELVTAAKTMQTVGYLDGGSIIAVPQGTRVTPVVSSGNIDLDVLLLRSNSYVASAMCIPYEILFKDFSRTNFSSGKMGLDAFYRTAKSYTDYNSIVYDMIFRLVMAEAKFKGLLSQDEDTSVAWVGPGRLDVNPLQSAKAENQRIHDRTETNSKVCADYGILYADVLKTIAKEKELEREILGEEIPRPWEMEERELRVTEIEADEEGGEE